MGATTASIGALCRTLRRGICGNVSFLLALLVMTRWKKSPHILFWGILAVLAFVLSVGDALRPLNKLLFICPAIIPSGDYRNIYLKLSLALSILTGFGMSFLLTGKGEKVSY